jgi:polyketide cyclase/dehydrase/lipid transport protein
MTISACPVAVVRAPAEAVWALLADPAGYGAFWDLRVRRVTPPGPAQPGQVVEGWPARGIVEAVDAARYQIRFSSRLPLGLVGLQVITCAPLDAASCRVTYG